MTHAQKVSRIRLELRRHDAGMLRELERDGSARRRLPEVELVLEAIRDELKAREGSSS